MVATYLTRLTERSTALAAALQALLISGGALLLGLSAQWKVLLPGSPVPVTFQTFAVFMLASLLGARLGAICVAAYVVAGLLGAPWFAAITLGPTLGYLVGFFLAARWIGSHVTAQASLGAFLRRFAEAQLIIYAAGVTGLTLFVGVKAALVMGVMPFLVGDALKIAAAALGMRAIYGLRSRPSA